jgi:hypothetical protein
VPNPSNQPSAEILAIGCADKASVENYLTPPFCTDIERIALAPPVPTCYIPHELPLFLGPLPVYSRGFLFTLIS